MRSHTLLASVALALTTIACGDSSSDVTTEGGVQMELEASQPAYAPGERVRVRARAENVGAKPVPYLQVHSAAIGLHVFVDTGCGSSELPWEGQPPVSLPVLDTLTLEPGAAVEAEFLWDRLCPGTVSLAPDGVHRVRAVFRRLRSDSGFDEDPVDIGIEILTRN